MKRLFFLVIFLFLCFGTAFPADSIPSTNLLDENGKRDGLWIEYFTCCAHYNYYRDGIQNGTAWSYNTCTGHLDYIGEMKNNEMVGSWYYFDNNSHLLFKFDDFKDTATLIPGVHHFTIKYAPYNCYCVDYYSNGRIRAEGRWFFFTTPEMDDTGEYGVWKYFDEEGNITKTILYE